MTVDTHTLRYCGISTRTFGTKGGHTTIRSSRCRRVAAYLPCLPVGAETNFIESFLRRKVAGGIMRRMGLHEPVATTDEAFIQMAIQLAADSSKRKDLRLEIANRCKIPFRDIEPVRALERCLTEAITQSRGKSTTP